LRLTRLDILKFCAQVRRSMTVARRTAPTATDFDSAIFALDVPRLDDQIRVYQMQPEINPRLLPTPPPDDPFHNHVELPTIVLGEDLGGQAALKQFHPNPSFLPPLPSAHTYRTSAVLPVREMDSRRIRELATEEGKLGEQALRKLAGAVKLDAAHPVDPETHKQAVSSHVGVGVRQRRKRRIIPQASEAELFEDTMRDLLKAESDGFELGPMVTSEKAYRMPDDGQAKRRMRPSEEKAKEGPPEQAKQKVYNTAPPPLPAKATAPNRYEGVEVMEF
jgi:hypothetical protein